MDWVRDWSVLRMSLKWLRPLLEDPDLDFQVIYLARDPRAVLSSRTKVPWCRAPSCRNPKVMCSLLTEDLAEVPGLLKAYPQRFKFVTYDRICRNVTGSLQDLMAFLKLPPTADQREFLQYPKIPRRRYGNRNNTFLLQAQLWRTSTSFNHIVLPVQNACRGSLEKLGLRIFASRKELVDLSVPAVVVGGDGGF
ncbi:carbohydrate sulfotransferase 5-like [Penaeus indicus]|uniref:carbohydrate sulfotransferase 5-like n=1 Tax=Penaeus indicus TaxID=29960 RepID=UPI00300CAB8E